MSYVAPGSPPSTRQTAAVVSLAPTSARPAFWTGAEAVGAVHPRTVTITADAKRS
jgi:hypothetical protein